MTTMARPETGRAVVPAGALVRRAGRVVKLALLPLLLVLTVVFVAEPMAIPSGSMEPTLMPGDQVLVNKLAYRLGSPHRGDLTVFHAPDGGQLTLKRIVGLPGDRVGIADGVLTVNGRLRHESYVDLAKTDSVYYGPVTVPAGRVFVMGDNRHESHDSRDFGPVAERDLMGKVLVRLWPIKR